MKIVINDKKVNKILNDFDKINKKIGLELTIQYKKRINELMSSNNFKEYLDIGLGNPHPLVGNLDGKFGIKLNKNYRLIVEPVSKSLDVESLIKCDTVELKGVADYHDGKCEWIIP